MAPGGEVAQNTAMLWVLLLPAAWAAAGFGCVRLCLAAAAAADGGHGPDAVHDREDESRPAGDHARGPYGKPELSLYEVAFLAGGPHRVSTLTLVSMHRARRLLLARTGWVTVVDPEGEDDVERSLIEAIGPGGQSPIATARRAAASTEAVRALSGRLVVSGLAVPEAIRSGLGAPCAQCGARPRSPWHSRPSPCWCSPMNQGPAERSRSGSLCRSCSARDVR